MKILHTSDLHLGRTLKIIDFYDDQKYMIDQLCKIIDDEKIDVMLISGDIYDKVDPDVKAMNLFNYLLTSLSQKDIPVLMINGNHDHSERLSFGNNLFAKLDIHIVSDYKDHLFKYSKDNVDFYLMPFLMQADVRKKMEDEKIKCSSSNDIVKWILSKEVLDKDKKNIILMHQFVSHSKGEDVELSDSESGQFVGTLDMVDALLLKDFDYVALGHIHRHQHIVKNKIVYSGTPMKYSFGEIAKKNGDKIDSVVVILDTDKDKDNWIKSVKVNQLRELRTIQGYYKDVIKMPDSDEIIRMELKDKKRVDNGYNNLIVKFPNIVDFVYTDEDKSDSSLETTIGATSVEGKSEYEIFEEFIKMHTGEELTKEEGELIKNIIDEVIGGK